jgi:hypothetical protein
LYRVKNTKYVGGIESDEYLDMLYKMKDQFIEAELYELAQECHDLIYTTHINQLISETQKIKI